MFLVRRLQNIVERERYYIMRVYHGYFQIVLNYRIIFGDTAQKQLEFSFYKSG